MALTAPATLDQSPILRPPGRPNAISVESYMASGAYFSDPLSSAALQGTHVPPVARPEALCICRHGHPTIGLPLFAAVKEGCDLVRQLYLPQQSSVNGTFVTATFTSNPLSLFWDGKVQVAPALVASRSPGPAAQSTCRTAPGRGLGGTTPRQSPVGATPSGALKNVVGAAMKASGGESKAVSPASGNTGKSMLSSAQAPGSAPPATRRGASKRTRGHGAPASTEKRPRGPPQFLFE